MKKILAAVDFSEPSVNAARYALQLVKDLPDASLVLYYAYSSVTAGSDGSPLLVSDNDRKTIAQAALQAVKTTLAPEIGSASVDLVVESGDLPGNLEQYVKHQLVDLVVMGITGSTKLEQMVIGSTTLNVISKDICPVLVVPGNAKYKQIKTVVLTSDLKDVENSTPIVPLTKILDALKPQLYIANVSQTHVEADDEQRVEKNKLEKLLQKYQPKSYFILEEEFEKGVTDFTSEYNVDLIITSPRKHSFLKRLFKSTHTHKLAFKSQIPILAIHSWN